MTAEKPKPEPKKTVNLSLSKEHLRRLDVIGVRENVGRSDMARRLIDREWNRQKMDEWEAARPRAEDEGKA